MIKCPACGRENRAGAGFCAWCGERFPQDVVAPPPVSPTMGEQPATAPSEEDAPEPTTEALATAQEAPVSQEEGPRSPERAIVPEEPPVEEAEGPAKPVGDLAEPGADVAEPDESAAQKPVTAPLHPGTILSGRYQIQELLESGPEQNVYGALDLCRCPSCGHDGNAPDDDYCLECGASLETRPRATIIEQLRRAPEQYDLQFSEGEREYFVTAEPKKQVEEEDRAPAMRLQWGRATHKGMQRDHNEDYLEAWLYARGSGSSLGLFVVADGLGGLDSGEVASRMATEAVWEALRPTVWEPIIRGETMEPDQLEGALAEAVAAANQAVYDARVSRSSQMSTTLTLALVVNGVAHIANVGDSRTYLWNADGLRQITRDHSLVQRLVEAGEIASEDVYTHPRRNLIYQSIGDRPEVQVDTFEHQLAPDDRLVLCSDGLWEMVRNEGLEDVLLTEPDPQRAADRLVHNANLAGGEDNISVIIVRAVGS